MGELRRGRLRYYYGPMYCGKSTVALQIHHSRSAVGLVGRLFTKRDRAGESLIASRLGVQSKAEDVANDTDFMLLTMRSPSQTFDYFICDEVQFYSILQIEQLARVADSGIDVCVFGLATDFLSMLFPASKRLFELSDEAIRVQVENLCWCGELGILNARVVDGVIARSGPQVLVGDLANQSSSGYVVLCRRHYFSGEVRDALK
jgi:thymidine kinase